jgi:hypothetical protein
VILDVDYKFFDRV